MNRIFFAVFFICAILLGASVPMTGLAKARQAAKVEVQQPAEAAKSPSAEMAEAPPAGAAEVQPEEAGVAIGARGEQVRIAQKFLADGGFYAGDIDGVFGPLTEKAVKEFQRSHNLQVTGIVSRETFTYFERMASEPSRYGRSLVMRASAYSAYDPGNGSYTYRGNRLRKGMVAVDPAVIPLGTRLYIKGYGYAVADDIGGAIKGNRIDLAFDSRRDALNFGVQQVTVYILD